MSGQQWRQDRVGIAPTEREKARAREGTTTRILFFVLDEEKTLDVLASIITQ